MQPNFVDNILKALDNRVPKLAHRTPEGRAMLARFLDDIYTQGIAVTRQSKDELKIQNLADDIYLEMFNSKCPYRVHLAEAATDNLFQSIYLFKFNSADDSDVDTLCHELSHVAYPWLTHGKRFDAKVKDMVRVAKRMLK